MNQQTPLDETQLSPSLRSSLAETQPSMAHRRPRRKIGCMQWILLAIGVFLLYFIFPKQINILVLGIDRAPEGTNIGRSDTNIMINIEPLQGKVEGISVPRDLWVFVPGYGENRINAAHFFGEAEAPDNGPQLALQTFEENFNIPLNYYARIEFEQFPQIIQTFGTIEIELERDMAGYPAGTHTLTSEQALAFVRSRGGADDFARMAQGQVMVKALLKALLSPKIWPKLPTIGIATGKLIDTNIPVWLWPRIAVAGLRAGPKNIDIVSIDREMITPWTTEGGAQVLLPNWEKIQQLIKEIF